MLDELVFLVLLLQAILIGHDWSSNERAPPQDLFADTRVECDAGTPSIRFRHRLPSRRYLRWDDQPFAEVEKAVTHCNRIGLIFYLWDSRQRAHFNFSDPDSHYRVTRPAQRGEFRDIIVLVAHVQPATGLDDPTISTNDALLNAAPDLQEIYVRFDGSRFPVNGLNVDEFFPYPNSRRPERMRFMSQVGTAPEFVGECTRPPAKVYRNHCDVLVYSPDDGIVFTLKLAYETMPHLDEMIKKALTILRQWRVG